MTNPILKEIHDIRREILAEHKDDLADYLRGELERAKAHGHPVAKVKQRTVRRTEATRSGDAAAPGPSSPGWH